jgi:hypothetical protein
MTGLSFVTPLSFDYRYAFGAIRSYYAMADEIVLGLDEQRLTWSGRPFEIDMERIRVFVAGIDTDRKIRIVEGDFHSLGDPMKNDTAERSALSQECAADNWVVQIDSDEILLNAADFRQWMLTANPQVAVLATWITVFKMFARQALVIDPPVEVVPIATRLRGAYAGARVTLEDYCQSPLQLLHFSWGRTPAELRQKLENWSHREHLDVEAFYRTWESVTLENYREFKNFHPVNGPKWPSLRLTTLRPEVLPEHH